MEPIYISGSVRCPQGDSDIFFTWDVRNGTLYAGVSANASTGIKKKADQNTNNWCNNFNFRRKHFDTLHEASRFVERYNTWF